MGGLLSQGQQQGQQVPQGQPQAQGPQSEMVDMGQAQEQITGAIDKLKRLVLAGQTILYGDQTSEKFLQFLDKDAVPQSVAEIAAMVLAALIDKSNAADEEKNLPKGTTFPPNLAIPVGGMLVNDLMDYACELYGIEITEELEQEALMAFAETMQRVTPQDQGQPQEPQQMQQQQPMQQPMQGAMQ